MFKFKHNGIQDNYSNGRAYNAIKHLKQHDESFSELFKKIGSRQLKVKDLLGAVKHTRKESQEFAKRIQEYRKEFDKSYEEKIKRVRAGLKRSD